MLQILLFLTLFPFLISSVDAEGYSLRYRLDEKGAKYKFKTVYRAKFTSLDEVRSLTEDISGTFQDLPVKILPRGGYRVSRSVHVENYVHNGREHPVEEYEKDLAGYEYILDPRKGKVKIVGSKTFDSRDAMEMVISFPRKEVKVGDTWRSSLYYNLKVGKQRKVPLKGVFKLTNVQGNIARIVGRYIGEVPPDRRMDYEGAVKWDCEFYFNLSKGEMERGRVVTGLKYLSKTLIAREFFFQSKKKERIGYALHLTSTFERD